MSSCNILLCFMASLHVDIIYIYIYILLEIQNIGTFCIRIGHVVGESVATSTFNAGDYICLIYYLLAHLAKDNVSFCHHLASVVRCLVSDWSISKKSFPLKPLSQLNRNLVGSIIGRSSYKDRSFRPDSLTSMATIGNFCFCLVDF